MSESHGQKPVPGLFGRLCAVVLVLAATALVALLESFYVLLRLGTVRVPLSLALAVVFHPLLTWLMRIASASSVAMLSPFALWLVVVFVLGLGRADGDLIITGNNWVSTALLLGGSLVFVASIAILQPRRARPGQVAPAGSLGGNGSA